MMNETINNFNGETEMKKMDEYLKSKWNKGTTKKVRSHISHVKSCYFKPKTIVIEHSIAYDGFNIDCISEEGTIYRLIFGYGGGLKKTRVL
jgi:hypothetical protein